MGLFKGIKRLAKLSFYLTLGGASAVASACSGSTTPPPDTGADAPDADVRQDADRDADARPDAEARQDADPDRSPDAQGDADADGDQDWDVVYE